MTILCPFFPDISPVAPGLDSYMRILPDQIAFGVEHNWRMGARICTNTNIGPFVLLRAMVGTVANCQST